jgi:hypothetical protein
LIGSGDPQQLGLDLREMTVSGQFFKFFGIRLKMRRIPLRLLFGSLRLRCALFG